MIRFTPSGGLDTDTENLYLSSGSYRYALNLRKDSISGEDRGSLKTINGNSLIVELAGVEKQTHRLRININLNSALGSDPNIFIGELSEFRGDIVSGGVNWGKKIAAYPALGTGDAIDETFAFILANLRSNNPDLNLGTPTLTKTSSYAGYFDLEITTVGYNYFRLLITYGSISSVDWGTISTTVLREGINVEGDLIPIGSVRVSDTTYLFSTVSGGGIGEIGALRQTLTNPSNSQWNYTRLLRSVELPFSDSHQITGSGERDGLKDSLYITDNNDTLLKFYLPLGNYVTDGGLEDNGGYLVLGSIFETMRLFSTSSSSYISDIKVKTSGTLTAGNKRYTGRFLTSFLGSTEFLPLSQNVPIFAAKLNAPQFIVGDSPGTVTDKSVTMSVQNIPRNVYKYFELAVIEFNGDSSTQKIVHRYVIPDGATSLNVEHTNIGQDNTDLSLEELYSIRASYRSAKTLSLLDNHLIASNLKSDEEYDLSAWAQTFQHYIGVKELSSVGHFGDVWAPSSSVQTTNSVPDIRLGEYMVPENVTNYTGYMFNDTYRFGVEVKWKSSGKWSKPYWVDDIKIDARASNVIGNRRSKSCDVTGGKLFNGDSIYVYHPVFHGIDFSYAVGTATQVADIVDEIRFVRSPRIPEVLATGLLLTNRWSGNEVAIPSPGDSYLRSNNENYGYFFSPDHFLGGVSPYTDISNISFNLTGITPSTDYIKPVTRTANSVEFGHMVQVGQPSASPNSTGHTISHCAYLTSGASVLFDSIRVYNSPSFGSILNHQTCDSLVVKFDSTKNFTLDTAVYQRGAYAQQFLNLGANLKYPQNKELSQYFVISDPLILSHISRNDEHLVFGGDVFTQKTTVRIFATQRTIREGLGYSFYSQNVVNSQLRSINSDGDGYMFPVKINTDFTTATYPGSMLNLHKSMVNWLCDLFTPEQQFYYSHYNAKDSVLLNTGFDTLDIIPKEYPSRVVWSMFKPNASVSDFNTVFQPLDYKDLDLNSGEITHHDIANGYLYLWQPREFRREYFNFSALLSSSQGDIIAGSGDNMSQRGVTISRYGSEHKYSIIKGKSFGGDDVFYWFSAAEKKIVRFGSDGVRVISDTKTVSSYLIQKVFNTDEDTPVTNVGINAVYNQRHSEAIFTFKLKDSNRFINPYGSTSVDGNVLNWNAGFLLPGFGLSGFEMVENQMYYTENSKHRSGAYNIFRYTGGIGTTQYAEPAVGSPYYELLDIDYANLHSIFTLAWDEKQSSFSSFYGFYPNLYIPTGNGYLTTKPTERNKVYLHDTGAILNFYGELLNYSFKFVFNYDPNLAKIFSGLHYNVEVKPELIEYETDMIDGYMGQQDVSELDGFFYSPITHQTRPVGKYLVVSISGYNGQPQSIFNFICKYRPSYILYQ